MPLLIERRQHDVRQLGLLAVHLRMGGEVDDAIASELTAHHQLAVGGETERGESLRRRNGAQNGLRLRARVGKAGPATAGSVSSDSERNRQRKRAPCAG